MNAEHKMTNENNNNPSTVLFVDDENQALKYFSKAFKKEHTILTSNSVDDAINVLEEHHEEIAVVICDQRMPIKYGIELLKYTHQNYPHIIRMLTTAYCDLEDSIHAINQAEVFRYIPKPWNLDDLNNQINLALKRYSDNTQIGTNFDIDMDKQLQQFTEDCQHWLTYSLRAYGDVEIYKGGIEALSHNFYERIQKHIELDQHIYVSRAINEILDKYFLSKMTLLNMQAQKDESLGMSGSLDETKH